MERPDKMMTWRELYDYIAANHLGLTEDHEAQFIDTEELDVSFRLLSVQLVDNERGGTLGLGAWW